MISGIPNATVNPTTGVITQVAASGEDQRFFTLINTEALLGALAWPTTGQANTAGRPELSASVARFPGVNSGGPATDSYGAANNSPNLVWTMGWNFQSGGGRLDTTKPAFGFSLEYNYFLSTPRGWVRGVEGHWKLQNAVDGSEHRPVSFWAPWDGGTGSALGLNMDTIVFAKMDASAADVVRVHWDFTVANFTQVNFQRQTVLQFPINAVPMFQQRNGANTSYIQLPNINALDCLAVSTPISMTASKVDVNGALMTLGLASGTIPNGGYGMFMSASTAAGASTKPWFSNISSTGTTDFASWNLGGGHSYFSAWVAVGNGDAATQYNVNGGGTWTVGLDNSDDDAYVLSQNNGLGSNNALRVDRTTRRVNFYAPIVLASYTVLTLPSPSTSGAGAMTYVTNDLLGAVPAFSDGIVWRRVTDRGIVA